MSLQTPEAIRTLQRKLYGKAKAEPNFRFYLLYDKIWREDVVTHAWALVKANAGAPGADGVTIAMVEAAGVEAFLSGLKEELRNKSYRPQAVRRVMIPKPGGGERPLGIPTVRDRVVQTAAKLILEPIFEADFENDAYGYRPRRSAADAVKRVHALLTQGYTDVVDADLSKYFDSIPHRDLMRSVARRIVDRHVLRLIKLWLKAPVEERDEDGAPRMTGGKGSDKGTPQGGVISPLLANLYMNRFLKYWRLTGRKEAFRAQVVAYADDFVILSRGHAAQALDWTQSVLERLGLSLNEAKTAIRDARCELFDFLGYSFGPLKHRRTGRVYLGVVPSKKSLKRVKVKVHELLAPHEVGAWPDVRNRLNALLRGWSAYFSYGTLTQAHRAVDGHVCTRVRYFLARRHKVPGHGENRFPWRAVFGELGVYRLRRPAYGSITP
jgi:RNA-directed DNA polymerase